jgi:hypothetical protein
MRPSTVLFFGTAYYFALALHREDYALAMWCAGIALVVNYFTTE